jgi:hypothetical protein
MHVAGGGGQNTGMNHENEIEYSHLFSSLHRVRKIITSLVLSIICRQPSMCVFDNP